MQKECYEQHFLLSLFFSCFFFCSVPKTTVTVKDKEISNNLFLYYLKSTRLNLTGADYTHQQNILTQSDITDYWIITRYSLIIKKFKRQHVSSSFARFQMMFLDEKDLHVGKVKAKFVFFSFQNGEGFTPSANPPSRHMMPFQRLQEVYKMSPRSNRRLLDVETTSCVVCLLGNHIPK